MLSQFWPVVLDSGYIFFISLLTALEEFHIFQCGWQMWILKFASPSLWPCSSSDGGGMHSTGYAGFGARRAMFLSCRQEVASLVVDYGS